MEASRMSTLAPPRLVRQEAVVAAPNVNANRGNSSSSYVYSPWTLTLNEVRGNLGLIKLQASNNNNNPGVQFFNANYALRWSPVEIDINHVLHTTGINPTNQFGKRTISFDVSDVSYDPVLQAFSDLDSIIEPWLRAHATMQPNCRYFGPLFRNVLTFKVHPQCVTTQADGVVVQEADKGVIQDVHIFVQLIGAYAAEGRCGPVYSVRRIEYI